MQVTQAADSTKVRRVGVEEDIIKFRPSPNFKNMKKFLKNRSGYTESTTLASSHVVTDPIKPQKVDQLKEVKPVVVQPPLPPYPPPPDSPLDINITIKKEKEDVETPPNNGDEPEQNTSLEQPPTESNSQLEERPKKTMCKEFIRGDCKRSVCRFSHEVDISQLRGVFTFCWNYQNAVCTYPNCKFVHATVFEEAEFYRTGMLPPHARAHLRRPLPPPPPPEEIQPEIINNFVNPPPSYHSGIDKVMPVISCIPASAIEGRSVEEELKIRRINSPLKREWSEINDFGSSSRDHEHKEHMAKKCKNCDLKEFSLQIKKEKLESMMPAEEIDRKLENLTNKCHKLGSVLFTLLKPAIIAKTGVNGLMMFGENDKILERLNNFVNSSNRLPSAINEDNVKSFLGSNMNLTNIIAKLLRGSGDQSSSPDTRET